MSFETQQCAFCTLPHERIVKRNQHSILIKDGFPISPGHSLIIPSRHVASFFDITSDERGKLAVLTFKLKRGDNFPANKHN